MALPNFNEEESFTQVTLLCGKNIGIKPWRVREEKDLLFAIEGQTDTESGRKEIIKMIRRCVDNQDLFDSLSNADYAFLITKLRQLSKGNKIEYTYTCSNPKCKLELSDDVLLDKNLITKPYTGGVVKIREDLSFSTKEVSFKEYDALKAKYDKTTEYNYHFILKSIESFAFKGEAFTEFTEADLEVALGTLKSEEFDILGKFINESVAEISLEKKLVCGKCKNVMDVQFGDLYYFLAF
jgi:hypothetical protein